MSTNGKRKLVQKCTRGLEKGRRLQIRKLPKRLSVRETAKTLDRTIQRIGRKVLAKKKKIDGRGKHTKASRAKKALELAVYYNSFGPSPTCADCNGTVFVPTDCSDSYACTSCGRITEQRIVDGATDISGTTTRSPPYRHCNYFAERIQQNRNLEPRFTEAQENKISVVWSMLHDRDGETWSNSSKSFSKYRFQQICGVLDRMEPGKDWKKKLERWWQARSIIYGEDHSWNSIDEETAFRLKNLFEPIACWFDIHFKKNDSGRHNIPKLDLLFLILLYNISEDALRKYGWYFIGKNNVWPTKSTLKDYARIKEITLKINHEFTSKLALAKRHRVKQDSIRWVSRNKYIVPELEYLIWIATDSKEGYITYNQLCTHHTSAKILLED